MTKIAITLRLSVADDASTSFAVQERACLAALQAADIAGDIRIFEDYGVSGATPLAQRKGMPDLMDWQPDYVIAWKLDRYARDVYEFLELVRWADRGGVVLMTADGSLNTRTPTGRMIAVILVALAEWMRSVIMDRSRGGHAERRAQGRWASGKPPWPYAAERREHGVFLVEDEKAFAICRDAIMRLLEQEENMSSTARRLPVSVVRWRRLLKGVILLGFREYQGAIVTESDGVTPVRYGPEVIDAATHARVLKRLDELAVGDRVQREDAPWLKGMIWCHCSAPGDGGTTSKARGSKPNYRCRAGHLSVLAEAVHPEVERAFLSEHGAAPLYHTAYVGGIDHSAEMAALDAQRARIRAAIVSVEGPEDVLALTEKLNTASERHAELAAAHDPVTRTVRTPLGMSMSDAWEGSTAEGRRAMLQDAGLRVVVHPAKRPGGRLEITWGTSPPTAKGGR